jgi:peptidoglycan-associated lipoprotein
MPTTKNEYFMMTRILIFTIGLFLLVMGLNAQPIKKSSYQTMIEVAEEQYLLGDYYNSLEWYEKAFQEKGEVRFLPRIAELHYLLRDYIRAERAYARLLRRDNEGLLDSLRFQYGRCLKINGKYPEAMDEFTAFINTTENDKMKQLAINERLGCELALELGESTKGVLVETMGRKINSPFSEYSAALAKGGKQLYFSGFEAKDVILLDDKADDYFAKIYVTSKEDDDWSAPKPLDNKINRPGVHSTHVSFSQDGRRMFMTRAILNGSSLVNQSRIYVSEESGEGWSAAQEVKGINGPYLNRHPVQGELFGREVLFFVSDMEGGYGGMDIYYATYEGNGVYSSPVNLGPVINTSSDEETPYYRDGTLYFSSKGHPGLGGSDIFYSGWDGASWSVPVNMGNGFNTSYDDRYFTLDEEGYKGFLLSNRPGGRSAHGRTCCDDIYSFEIAKLYADLVVGVFDERKAVMKGATVTIAEFQGDQNRNQEAKTNASGNRFDFGLKLEMPYRIIASAEGYFPDTIQFNTVGITESKTFQFLFYLKAIPVVVKEPEFDTISIEEAIVLENILYDFDDDRIKESAEADLKVVLELMQQYADMKIELSSHTDYRGNDRYNEDLSQRRAESARRWLMRNGIARERIEAMGYGESKPKEIDTRIAPKYPQFEPGIILTPSFIDELPDDDLRELAHSINRRTEFKILEGPKTIIIKREKLIRNSSSKGSLPTLDTIPPIHYLSSLYGKTALKGVPIMHFDERVIQFGKVKRGEKRTHTYHFTNYGDVPLVISMVSACECTQADWSKAPVGPGKKGKIVVTFDSSSKSKGETIDIDIILDNVEPSTGNPIFEAIQYKFEIIP